MCKQTNVTERIESKEHSGQKDRCDKKELDKRSGFGWLDFLFFCTAKWILF